MAAEREQAGARAGRALVVTRWEDGTEVVFGLGSGVVGVDAGVVKCEEEYGEVSGEILAEVSGTGRSWQSGVLIAGEPCGDRNGVPQKVSLVHFNAEEDDFGDEKFFDACEEQIIEIDFLPTLPHQHSAPPPPSVIITLAPPSPTHPTSPAIRSNDPPPPPFTIHLAPPSRPAPPAHDHSDTFIAIYESELVKVLDGQTHDVVAHSAPPAHTHHASPGAAVGGEAPGGTAPGWTWRLLLRLALVLLAFCVAWTACVVVGIWNAWTGL